MSDMDFSKILDALRTPQPPTLQPPARPAAPFVAVGAGAYRTASIVPDVMPLPRPSWWVRAQAIVLHAIVGRRRAATRQWYRRACGGHWSQVLDRDGDATWMPVPLCPATLNAHMHPAGPPVGACFDDDALFNNGAPVVCHCERWP